MTMHTKAATDEIYEIFNQPLKPTTEDDEDSGDDDGYETDGDYTSGIESNGTTRQIATSEAGDDEDETSDAKSVSEWSDFTARKHIPELARDGAEEYSDDTQIPDLTHANNQDSSNSEATGSLEEDEPELTTPVSADSSPRTRTIFVPIPPEDYEPRTRPFRDPAEVANNRLPFMTPIAERTESSLTVITERQALYRTPTKDDETDSPTVDNLDLETLSSPLREVVNDARSVTKVGLPLLQKVKPSERAQLKGPLITDLQCNPVDEMVRSDILARMQPPLSSYSGFYDHRNQKYEKGCEIRKYAKAFSKAEKGNDRISSISTPVVIQFPDGQALYTVKKEIGAGAFAPVYLVENSAFGDDEIADGTAPMGQGVPSVPQRKKFEALKMELPPTPWEFHIMRLAHSRLGPQHRATASISYAHVMHLYEDEGFLFLPFYPHGTLLDVVNTFRAEPSGVMDEQLAMYFTVELLRTVEALHSRNILHGDLKADNCLLRLDGAGGEPPLASQYRANGMGGWSRRGIVLIDFGRGVDMRCFRDDVEFIADWKTSAQDCAEMREGRPWTWQIDYHGLAGIIHCLLFGKYIETARYDQGGLGKTGRKYKTRESLKRYWQTEIWGECFELLLNPGSFVEQEEGGKMPILRSMKRVRERMEEWLESNCERGVGLKSLMAKIESSAKSKK
jgi:checkpoint serine/threonine-protein kinase